MQTNLLVEGFFTDLRDVFALRQLDEADEAGNAVLERYNGSGARVMGLNIEAKAFFSSHFDMQEASHCNAAATSSPSNGATIPKWPPKRKCSAPRHLRLLHRQLGDNPLAKGKVLPAQAPDRCSCSTSQAQAPTWISPYAPSHFSTHRSNSPTPSVFPQPCQPRRVGRCQQHIQLLSERL